MKYLARVLVLTPILLLFLQVWSAIGQESQGKKPWKGKLADGKVITQEDLDKIFDDHWTWLITSGEEGSRADLSGADLSQADLSWAYMSEANLSRTDLSEAKLDGADLSGAYLGEVDLRRAKMSETDLEDAYLSEANLTGANLSKANLQYAKLKEAVLRGISLTEAKLFMANLSKANLQNADLTKASLFMADLTGADLTGADLNEAQLGSAILKKAILKEASLNNADLYWATLEEATLTDTNLKGAWTFWANFAHSHFAPVSLEGFNLLGVKGLATAKFKDPQMIVQLRANAKKFGLRSQERALTAALRRYRALGLLNFEGLFEYVLINLPTDYGASPWRSLGILFMLIPIFTIFYTTAVITTGKDGIWKVWIPDRVRKDLGEEQPERLSLRGRSVWKVGFYFSILSAFSIGWRELNVGNWISRIQRREYNLRASGWVRSISGIQSLFSVYLLALWALTYFSRPFG